MEKHRDRKTARFFTVLFAFVFALALFASAAYAAEGDTGTTADGFAWEELSGGKIEITGYTGAGGEISIPSSVNDLPVTSVKGDAFKSNATITSADIPGSVTSIGNSAFSDCTILASVTLHEGLETIGENAFHNTVLAGITMPGSVTSIGKSAFSYCLSLASITLNDGLVSIGESAFYSAAISGITVPGSVTSNGVGAFSHCPNLVSVTLSDGLVTIGDGAFYSTPLAAITIPGSVTSIGYNAFCGCGNLASITLSDGLVSIGESAFYGTSLTAITIPGSVTSIGKNAFFYCLSITSVTLGDGLVSIGEGAFYGTSLTAITIPGSVTSIGGSAFSGCTSLARAVIYSRTAAFGSDVFDGDAAIGGDGIHGFSGSTAQTYASAEQIPFHPIHTVAFDTAGGPPIDDVYILGGDTMSAPAAPVWSAHIFGGWYLNAGLSQSAAFPLAVSADTTLYAKWTALTLTLSPSNGHIYTDGRVTITPSVQGGAWSFDGAYFSHDGNRFTGLKAGTTRVTYTVGNASVFADITIRASQLPPTGQDCAGAWALGGAGLLAALAALMLTILNKMRKHARETLE